MRCNFQVFVIPKMGIEHARIDECSVHAVSFTIRAHHIFYFFSPHLHCAERVRTRARAHMHSHSHSVRWVCVRARAFSRFTAKIATDEILKYTHSEGIQLLCISSFFCVVLPLPEFRS